MAKNQNSRAYRLHRFKLLMYLADPANEPLSWIRLSREVLGITPQALYKHFTPAELSAIKAEALETRRKMYARKLAAIDQALLKKAEEGDLRAVKLVYQRFEGWAQK